jgi:endonuclease III
MIMKTCSRAVGRRRRFTSKGKSNRLKIVFLKDKNRFFFNNAVFSGKTVRDGIYIHPMKKELKVPVDIDGIYAIVKKEFKKHHMPVVDLIHAQTQDPFKVLIATILSARTKDKTTAEAARRLFSYVNNFSELRNAPLAAVEKLIYPVGFYATKARMLKRLPDAVDGLFDGKIPDTVEELIKLPGVGRKTANLVVAVAFNKPAVCVDVHVHRICNRLGYVKTKNPFETEMALRKILPVRYWTTFNSYLVSFGQNTCAPINPKCSMCPIGNYCNRVGVKTKFRLETNLV